MTCNGGWHMFRPATLLWACSQCKAVTVMQGCFDVLRDTLTYRAGRELPLWNISLAGVYHQAVCTKCLASF